VGEVGTVADAAEAVARASIEGAEQLLREVALCPPPTVHILSRHMAPPYLGYVSSRPFYRGMDAAHAVRELGLLPSLLCATQLVVVWEYADLCTAIDLPNDRGFPTAIVVLDANLDDHVLRWHPFEMRVGPIGSTGLPTVVPEWGSPSQIPGAPLPLPVVDLLARWREWRPGDVGAAIAELEAAGYRIWWAQRP
jgi:hypothetical protein